MAIRVDASTDTLTSTGLAGGTATILCWMRVVTDTNDFGDVWQFSGPEASFGSLDDGTTFLLYDGAFTTMGSTALTVGTWYRTAAILSGTAWTFLRGAAGVALTSTGATMVAITSPTTLSWGLGAYSGRIANAKVYTAALTQAECEAELAQYVPVRTANLDRWHPWIGVDLTDYSGNGRTLTAGGTATTTEDGPPIPWTLRPPVQPPTTRICAATR